MAQKIQAVRAGWLARRFSPSGVSILETHGFGSRMAAEAFAAESIATWEVCEAGEVVYWIFPGAAVQADLFAAVAE